MLLLVATLLTFVDLTGLPVVIDAELVTGVAATPADACLVQGVSEGVRVTGGSVPPFRDVVGDVGEIEARIAAAASGASQAAAIAALQATSALHTAEIAALQAFDLTVNVPKLNALPTRVILAGDVTNANPVANTLEDVTGLSFPVTAGKTTWFQALVQYEAALITTGSRWALNSTDATLGTLRAQVKVPSGATTTVLRNDLNAYDNSNAITTASASAAANLALIEGYITPAASGTVVVRFASEVALSGITAKAGSILWYVQEP